jgi:hypothetical protein
MKKRKREKGEGSSGEHFNAHGRVSGNATM